MGVTMSAALDLFAELAITYRGATAHCRPGEPETNCRALIDRLISQHGMPHGRQVLLTFTETTGNADMMRGPLIMAVSDLLLHHRRWRDAGEAWLSSFDEIKLRDTWKTTKATRIKAKREVSAALLFVELERLLGPPILSKPPRVKREPKPPTSAVRIPIIERRIATGLQLLELKAKTHGHNELFSSLRRNAFPDLEPKLAMQAAAVAKRYGSRPEIFRRVGWRPLVQLSSPSLSTSARMRFEARILAGEDIRGVAVKRACGRLPSARPGRRQRSDSQLAA
jgi:hypothetical protein